MAEKKSMDDVLEDVVKMEYPSNSFKKQLEKPKSEQESNKPVRLTKVVTGAVVTKKRGWTQKFAETFFGDDVTSVSSYIVHDVLVPAAKNTLSDLVSGGINMLLFGESRARTGYRDKNKSIINYNSLSSNDRSRRNDAPVYRNNRALHNFGDILFETRGEAEEVLSYLFDLTVDYQMASVADLYDLVGMESAYTDTKYGWFDLRGVSVRKTRQGYLLTLPKPVLLD